MFLHNDTHHTNQCTLAEEHFGREVCSLTIFEVVNCLQNFLFHKQKRNASVALQQSPIAAMFIFIQKRLWQNTSTSTLSRVFLLLVVPSPNIWTASFIFRFRNSSMYTTRQAYKQVKTTTITTATKSFLSIENSKTND